jgi:carbon-monoxide dehydrogenase small subunit
MTVSHKTCEISLSINGTQRTCHAHPMERLLDVLRHQLALTGAKEGCGEGECGSCSVLMDGVLINSCLVPVLQANGTEIITIEGLAKGPHLHALQKAFLDCGGAQCGICTPGMILASYHLLSRKPHPTHDEIREFLAGNLCRCTGYAQIIEAVAEAAQEVGAEK